MNDEQKAAIETLKAIRDEILESYAIGFDNDDELNADTLAQAAALTTVLAMVEQAEDELLKEEPQAYAIYMPAIKESKK